MSVINVQVKKQIVPRNQLYIHQKHHGFSEEGEAQECVIIPCRVGGSNTGASGIASTRFEMHSREGLIWLTGGHGCGQAGPCTHSSDTLSAARKKTMISAVTRLAAWRPNGESGPRHAPVEGITRQIEH